ncbi:MAG: GPW/gp25 family protein, partial [Ilumatobacteraceae bacterium]
MPVDHDFVGTGWAFPPQLTASGGIAMVRRERELEESMRIILLTYPGERPMRPEFGSRVRDFVFRSVDDEMTTALA